MKIEIPLRTVNCLNKREHPMARHRRVQKERRAIHLAATRTFDGNAIFARAGAAILKGQRILVTMTRISSGELDEGDGLNASMKAVRDQIAAELGCDDSPRSPLRWAYAQQRSKRGVWGVRIEIEAAP